MLIFTQYFILSIITVDLKNAWTYYATIANKNNTMINLNYLPTTLMVHAEKSQLYVRVFCASSVQTIF